MRNPVSAFLSTRLSSLFESSPLRHAQFRMFYFGTIAAALGYMMQTTIAAWVMATLTPSVLMVALVQTASTAPSLIVGLVAGTMADLVDRRKLITINMIILTVATLILGAATLADLITPPLLLALTFVVGASFTFYMPAQSASVNELVAREELPRAIALGAVAYNVARAIGPALAGAIAAALGSGSALLVSAAFFALMVVAVRRWKSHVRPLAGVPETLLSGALSHPLPHRCMNLLGTPPAEGTGDHCGQAASRQACGKGRHQSVQASARPRRGRRMQAFDFRGQCFRQRHRRFESDAMARARA